MTSFLHSKICFACYIKSCHRIDFALEMIQNAVFSKFYGKNRPNLTVFKYLKRDRKNDYSDGVNSSLTGLLRISRYQCQNRCCWLLEVM